MMSLLRTCKHAWCKCHHRPARKVPHKPGSETSGLPTLIFSLSDQPLTFRAVCFLFSQDSHFSGIFLHWHVAVFSFLLFYYCFLCFLYFHCPKKHTTVTEFLLTYSQSPQMNLGKSSAKVIRRVSSLPPTVVGTCLVYGEETQSCAVQSIAKMTWIGNTKHIMIR